MANLLVSSLRTPVIAGDGQVKKSYILNKYLQAQKSIVY